MYLFIHIPKTAGTTFGSILRKNFKDKYVRIYGLKKVGFFSEAEMRALATFFPKAQCISAHEFTCPIPQPDKESGSDGAYRLITFLRDPVERSLSHYFFQKKQIKMGVKKEFAELPYEQYFEKIKERGLKDSGGRWSYQADMQAYILDRDYNMEVAKKRMKEEFFFVGVSERFDESLLILKKKFAESGIDFKINYFSHNVTGRKKSAKEALSPEIYQKVFDNNKKDKELWDYANLLLDEEVKKYGESFSVDFKKFRRKLKIMGIFAGLMNFLEKVIRRLRELGDKWFSWPLGVN